MSGLRVSNQLHRTTFRGLAPGSTTNWKPEAPTTNTELIPAHGLGVYIRLKGRPKR